MCVKQANFWTIHCNFLLCTVALTASTAIAHAEPSLSDIAAQIQALRDENRQMRAENRQIKDENKQMRAAISDMKGETRRTREKVRAVAERAPVYPAPLLAGVSSDEGKPVLVTADKKFKFGAITITPGGFVAAEDVFRTRATNAEMTNFPNNIPFGPQAGIHENRFSARQTRPALLIEGAITPTLIASGYGEFDFNNQGVSSNYNQANSWVPRIRNLYAGLDSNDYGLHVLAGQNWSLTTLNSKGITPRNEALPPVIDGNTITGFAYKRQAQIRLTKDFDKKLWLSLSVENPQTTFSNCTTGINATAGVAPGVSGITCDVVGTTTLATVATSAAGTASAQALSVNYIPDVIGKAAYEARIGERDIHVEGYGMFRDFSDRVAFANNTTSNMNTHGYGVGFGVIIPVVPRRLDFQGSGLIGRGLGSYGPAQLPDATLNASGSPDPIREQMFNAGFIAHVTPAIDLYAFGGIETEQATYFANGATLSGFGAPNANNSGCFNVGGITGSTACAGATKRIYEITGGFVDKLYRGSFGEIRMNVQYAYFQRELFQGTAAGVTTNLNFAPKQNDNVVMTSFRYYPFQ